MSALGGIYNLDSAPVDEGVLVSLSKGLAARGPDGGREVRLWSVGMAYRAFHTNRESRLERQPLVSANRCILAWDGRLDNYQELLALLRSEIQGPQTDAAIIIAAYQKWGIDFLSRLTGDFALSLWDPHTARLVLARDLAGARPLLYHVSPGSVIWSSDLEPLLSSARIDLAIDDEYVAGYLVGSPETGRTPYSNIRSVPPGAAVIVQGGRIEVRRFWKPDPNREIRYLRDSEYEEHFRQLFREAVRCRLRADGPVWAELSGGLDSSSIVCMADHIRKKGEGQASIFKTISYVFDASPTCDEREYITCVEEKIGRRGFHQPEDEYWMNISAAVASSVTRPNPHNCVIGRHKHLSEAMRKDGARVLLSGTGGDHMLWSGMDASPELADVLTQCKLFRLHRSLLAWSQAQKIPYLKALWRGGIRPALSRKVQLALGLGPQIPKLLNPTFVAQMNLSERLLGQFDTFGFRLPSSRMQLLMLSGAITSISACYQRDWGYFEMTYPYLHRPLVEFLLAIPFEQILRPGETRSLQRRAMRDLLPVKVAQRRSKRGPNEALCRALVRDWPMLKHILTAPHVCSRGYIDPQALEEALNGARHGTPIGIGTLLETLSLEIWLRSLESRRAPARGCLLDRRAESPTETRSRPSVAAAR